MTWIGLLALNTCFIASASVSIVAAGAFWTKMSPGLPCSNAHSTRSTAPSIDIMNRVMSGSVTVSGLPAWIWRMNSGTTDPRLAITLP